MTGWANHTPGEPYGDIRAGLARDVGTGQYAQRPLAVGITKLRDFVRESNRIEGIVRDPTQTEVDAHASLLTLKRIALADIEAFVRDVAAVPLRRAVGQNVRVGSHYPPPGGPAIEEGLEALLLTANSGSWSPYRVHTEYEKLHPFLDGNGRSGRALWAWMMRRAGRDPFALPFLHRWYYDSLDEGRRP